MCRTGVDRDHAVRRLAQRKELTQSGAGNDHVRESCGGADLLEHRHLFGGAAQHQQSFAAASVDSMQQFRPALERPPFVVRVQPAPACAPRPHAAMIARLQQDELTPVPALGLQPGITLGALGREHMQARAVERRRRGQRVVCRTQRRRRDRPQVDEAIDPRLRSGIAADKDAAAPVHTTQSQHPPDSGQLAVVTLADIDRTGRAVTQRAAHA